jgi:hypothetical protein
MPDRRAPGKPARQASPASRTKRSGIDEFVNKKLIYRARARGW